jgi:transposase
MKPLSEDLISKIVSAYQQPGSTFRLVAKQMRISKNTVHKYVSLHEEGSLNDSKSKHSKCDPSDYKSCLAEIFTEHPDATLAKYCQILQEKTGRLISIPTMSRAIKDLRLSKSRCKRARNSKKSS